MKIKTGKQQAPGGRAYPTDMDAGYSLFVSPCFSVLLKFSKLNVCYFCKWRGALTGRKTKLKRNQKKRRSV